MQHVLNEDFFAKFAGQMFAATFIIAEMSALKTEKNITSRTMWYSIVIKQKERGNYPFY